MAYGLGATIALAPSYHPTTLLSVPKVTAPTNIPAILLPKLPVSPSPSRPASTSSTPTAAPAPVSTVLPVLKPATSQPTSSPSLNTSSVARSSVPSLSVDSGVEIGTLDNAKSYLPLILLGLGLLFVAGSQKKRR